MTVPFGQNDNRFTWSVFLVLCNRLMTCILALGALRVSPSKTSSQTLDKTSNPDASCTSGHERFALNIHTVYLCPVM